MGVDSGSSRVVISCLEIVCSDDITWVSKSASCVKIISDSNNTPPPSPVIRNNDERYIGFTE